VTGLMFISDGRSRLVAGPCLRICVGDELNVRLRVLSGFDRVDAGEQVTIEGVTHPLSSVLWLLGVSCLWFGGNLSLD
jgi:hypothetical protein